MASKKRRKIFSTRKLDPTTLPKLAGNRVEGQNSPKLYRAHSNYIAKHQLLNWDPDKFMVDLRGKISFADRETGESQLRAQLQLLHARHLFVTRREPVRAIAAVLRIPASGVYEWVDMYDWRDMRETIYQRRSHYFAHIQEVNEYQIEQQTDRIFQRIQSVCLDLLDGHLDADDPEARLKPAELKAIADTAKTAFEVRGAMVGSEKIGQKMEVKFSLEMQSQVNEMMKHLKTTPAKQIEHVNAPRITIEDAEFDELPVD